MLRFLIFNLFGNCLPSIITLQLMTPLTCSAGKLPIHVFAATDGYDDVRLSTGDVFGENCYRTAVDVFEKSIEQLSHTWIGLPNKDDNVVSRLRHAY